MGYFCCLLFKLTPGCGKVKSGAVHDVDVAQSYALIGINKVVDTVASIFEQVNLHQMRASTLKI